MLIMVGSARIDENGKATGGKAGDQKQTGSGNDMKGEVSAQEFYVHKKGWYILRPKDPVQAGVIACKMLSACNNAHIGYDQSNRLGVVTQGIDTKTDTECDCSSLVRACVKEAAGKDPGDFTTMGEASALEETGLFEKRQAFISLQETPVYNGDVLVTKTQGHTVIVISGNPRQVAASTAQGGTGAGNYPKYTGSSGSIVDALAAVGEKDTSFANRKKIAVANGISGYTGTATQNGQLVAILKKGELKKNGLSPTASTVPTGIGSTYYPKYTGSSGSIVDALAAVGEKDTSFSNRKKIAAANGISGYAGTAAQNTQLLGLLKKGTLIRQF